MTVTVEATLADFNRQMESAGKQLRFAVMRATNDAARAARTAVQAGMRSQFDRPTPFVVNSVWVEFATRENLSAKLFPRYPGGKAVDPTNVLVPQVEGGGRKLKRSERALQSAGILPRGFFTVPGQAAPLDAYGNVKGAFIVQLITYLQASGEQGYRANMTARRKTQLARAGRSAGGYKMLGGVRYFVALGKLRGGSGNHLAPGIWSSTGIHGSDVKPVLMFVRKPMYSKRLDYLEIAQRTVAETYPPAFRTRLAEAMRTAR